jgi:hypothetical protein
MTQKLKRVSEILIPLMKEYGLGAKINEYKILKIWDLARRQSPISVL